MLEYSTLHHMHSPVAHVLKYEVWLMSITVACSGAHEEYKQAILSPSAKGIAYVTLRLVGDKP